nr:HlyD family secretion protein [Rhizobium setariae]
MPEEQPQIQKGNPLRGIAFSVLIITALLFALSVFMERRTPITSQATIQAYVVGIAPEVNGRVVDVPVSDNSRVKAGQVLFRIDPEQFEIAVREAESRLGRVGQEIGVSTANVDAAQARLVEANATLDNTREQANRSAELLKKGAVTAQRAELDATRLKEMQATVLAAEADLRRAREELGPAGNDNPQIQEALAALGRAQLDVIRSTVKAPSDGVVTNLQLSIGSFATAGKNAITFIDTQTLWITAAFKENSLENVAPGNKAEILFDALPGKLYPATVESVGLGVAQGSVDPETGLPKVSNENGWIRTPQSFPVRLILQGERPKGVRYGAQAHVVIYTGEHPVTNLVGQVWMNVLKYLTYLN